jgi:ABC-type phosphate transport system substrate-binding protein
MKYTLALGTLCLVGASISGAGALALRGSDTLETITNLILPGDATHDCGAASLTYAGTGTGNGELALQGLGGFPLQQIAPMSRALKVSVCNANPNYDLNVVALDGLAIINSRREGTPGVIGAALNATVITDPALKTCLGVKYSTGAPFNRIRAVFSGGDGTTALANGSAANCNSAFRKSILNNWTNFTTSLCGRAGNPIRHAFRRDDASGTTDAFKSIVGVSGFCNGTALGGSTPGVNANQDNDPIRRTCDADEQVCSPAGDLGVVLAISVPSVNPYPGAGSPPDTLSDRQARHANGEFHRLHQSKTLAKDPVTGLDVTACRRSDSTQQIGCLVAVSPYSTGYAGLEGTKVSGATYLKVGNVIPSEKTVRNPPIGLGNYPIRRNLYLNNLVGNAAVTGDEAKLQACFLDRAYADPKVVASGFISFSNNPADGAEAAYATSTCF